jgi:hypothetical protein
MEAGRLLAPMQVRGFGAQAVYAMAVAILLDSGRRIDRHRTFGEALRRCKYEGCRRFFLSHTTDTGGRPAEFDTPACKVEHFKLTRARKGASHATP